MSGVSIAPADTSRAAAQVHATVLRRLGSSRRMEMIADLSDSMRTLVEAGVRLRHPGYSEEDVRWSVARILIGEQLFRRTFPDRDVTP